jgi:hypothetical protein
MKMKCCCCKSKLVITHQDHYPAWYEYIGGEIPLKAGYQCINAECVANALNIVWTPDGSIQFIPNLYLTIAMMETIINLSSDGIPYPFGSQLFYEEMFVQAQREMSISLKIRGFKFLLEPGVSPETPVEKKFEKITWFRPSLTIHDTRHEFEVPVNLPWVDFKERYVGIKTLLKKVYNRSPEFQWTGELDKNLSLTRTLTRMVFPRTMEDLTWGERLGTYVFRLMNWKIASKVRKISDELKEKESQTVGQ